MRWLLIFWIFVVSAVAYLDRVNVSITGRAIATEFHLDNVQLGWVFSAFVLGYAVFQAPAGWFADRIGPRIALTLGVLWWGVFTALITVLPAGAGGILFLLVGVRFALGIGEAVVYPASNCVVSSWIPSAERGLANGIIFSGVGFGAGVTPPLIAYLMIHYGWRSAFWVSAAIGLAAGAIWFVLARDTPQRHPWVSPREVQQIESGLPASSLEGGTERLPWSTILVESRHLDCDVQLFYVWLCSVHFLQLVFYLFERCSWAEFAAELLLRDAAVPGDGRWITVGRMDQRPADEGVRQARGPLRDCGGWHRPLRGIHCTEHAGCERRVSQLYARGRSGGALSIAELVLVGERGYRRAFRRLRFRVYEYGRAIRRSPHGIADAHDREAF